jgi:hypothetical protein
MMIPDSSTNAFESRAAALRERVAEAAQTLAERR